MASIPINVEKLRTEIAIRGVTYARFADAAGVSPATLTHALQGHAISITTLRRIAGAMLVLPVVPGLGELVAVTAAVVDKDRVAPHQSLTS